MQKIKPVKISSRLHKDLRASLNQIKTLLKKSHTENKPQRLKLIYDIFKTALELAHDSQGSQNLKIASITLQELRYSFKIFFPHRFAKKITMFGSARVLINSPLYNQAKKFAELATKKGYNVITGGGPGIMAAGNEGSNKTGFGLNIRLPFEKGANKFIDENNRLVNYKYFFTRKLFLVKEASAGVFFPGGFGTFDEGFEMLTLLQTGKTQPIPIVFIEPKGYGFWQKFFVFLGELRERKFISQHDGVFYTYLNSPASAINYIQRFYKNYHSLRFINDTVIFRLKKPLSPERFTLLKCKFAGLSADGEFTQSGALPEEKDDYELNHLFRISFKPSHPNYTGFRELINFINK